MATIKKYNGYNTQYIKLFGNNEKYAYCYMRKLSQNENIKVCFSEYSVEYKQYVVIWWYE